jgi:amino acid adenylation domain-containing protein
MNKMRDDMTSVPPDPQSLSGNERSLWDAFECPAAGQSAGSTRDQEDIALPPGLTASMNDLITVAAVLGSLLSPEGRVTLGIHDDGKPSQLGVDCTALNLAEDARAYIAQLRDNAEAPLGETQLRADIEISDGKSLPAAQSPVWLLVQDGRCQLSVRSDRMTRAVLLELLELVAFACARVLDPKALPASTIQPACPALAEAGQRQFLVERIYRHVQSKPSAVAIVDDNSDRTLTYAELWDASEALVQHIRERVTSRRSSPRLVLFLERGWQHLASIIAVQRMGGTCVLIDPAHPDERIRAFIEECSPHAVLTAGSTTERARDLVTYSLLDIDKVQIRPTHVDWEHGKWVETTNEACFISGTSGSTGRPKAVCLSYRGMAATLDAIIDQAGLAENSRGSWLSSPGYGMVEVDPLPILCAGGTVCIPAPQVLQDVNLLARWLLEGDMNHTLAMTSIAEALWATGARTGLRTMLIAGERCKQWPPADLGYRVINVYGSAEAAVVSIEDLCAPRRTLLPSVGRAIPGARMYVVDRHGQQLAARCVGELIITGETLSVGYVNPEDTKKAFRGNTLDATSPLQYSTGDRARMAADGTVEIFGRTDSVVKIRGHRVDLTELEITALQVPGVVKAAATCLSNDLGATLALFLELAPDAVEVVAKVRKHLAARLHPAAQPGQIVIGTLPLGRNGKVDYSALQVGPIERDAGQTVFAPVTQADQAVRDCWLAWTLCEEAILESSFFDAGGDSLRALRMVGELACKHGIHVQMGAFLEEPVLANLVRLANASRNTQLPKFEHLPAQQQLLPFELNESQQALWIGRGSFYDYGGVGCQGYFEWEVQALDRERFTRAVGLLVERHPMLRMTIDASGRQSIGDVDGTQAVEYVDLSALDAAQIDREIDRVRERMANEEIGTTQWPLFQFRISRISASTSRVHLCIDMLIADAWSIFQVIIPDLIDLYLEDDPQLPVLQTSFHDYVAYRQKVLKSAQYQADREYWLDKINHLPAAPRLPQLEPGEFSGQSRFERHEGTLAVAAWERLQAQAQARNISPSGVVALALCEVLRCWSEEDRFTLNFPVSDRMPVSADIDQVVGDFTNTLLVPYETAAADTLEARGQQLQGAIWQALDHRLFNGVEVLRELARGRRSGGAPLMPIVLTSLLGHPGRHDAARLGQEVYGVSQTPQVTLDVQLRESEGTLYFKWDYLTGVIRPEVVESMFGAFCTLLQQLADDSEIWQRTWLDLRPAAQIEVRHAVNATQAPVPEVHLRDLLLARIAERAGETAVLDAQGSYSWGEIGRAAARISEMIQQARNPGERFVGIVLPKGSGHYAAVYGCLLAGVGYVPVDIDLPSERIRSVLSQAGVHTVIAGVDTQLPEQVERLVLTDEDLRAWTGQHTDLALAPLAADYSPYVIFTSGSTGNPKGVEIPEAAVVNHVYDVVERFGLDASTRHLATAALHFDMSVFDIFGPLLHGGSVVVPAQAAGPDPDTWLRLQRRHGVTFWACVPAIMDLLCSVAETARSFSAVESLANIVMAGDWIPLPLLPRARALYPKARLYSCGGPTETTNWSVLHEIDEQEGQLVRSVIYGAPMRNSAYHIVAGDWTDCPDWVPGEMLVESDVSLACGYIGQPELTRKAFVQHPRNGRRMYRTGDLGRYLPNGEIEILGRIDNQIKLNGLRIELGEIESVTESCPGVSRACAVVLPGPDGHPKQIALVYVGEPELAPAITLTLTLRLPVYMVPKTVQQLPQLPLSKNGKVDVLALRETLRNDMKDSNSKTPRTILRTVIRVISSHLEEPVVLPEDNFFDLGGDSLSAMKIKIELESQLSITVPLENLMLTETISEFANSLDAGNQP